MDAANAKRFAEFLALAGKLDPSPRPRKLGLRLLFVAPSLVKDFPRPDVYFAAREVYDETIRALARDWEGENRNLEGVLAELGRYGVAREEALRRSDVPVALYHRVVELSKALDHQRGPVLRSRRSYADLLRQLQRDRYMSPAVRRAAIRETVLILRYLAQFPTKEQARRWRRRLGIDKDGKLDRLKVWTNVADRLTTYLDSALGAYGRTYRLPRGMHAVKYASAILCARYPRVFRSLPPERLRKRIGW